LRDRFVKTLTDLSVKNKNIIILSGDIGNRMFDNFKKINPKKFYNCGIAEANMVSMASGLASTGFLPFVYTITPFVTTRCLEQIKIGLSYHNYPVTIVGTGSGLSYSELGPTHHSFEDISILRSLPNIRILTPGDPNEVEEAIKLQLKNPKPTYIRLGKKGESNIKFLTDLKSYNLRLISKGDQTLILSMGNITYECSIAVRRLMEKNIYVSHAHVFSIKPFDYKFLNKYKSIITVEEHSIYGGLGSIVSEYISTSSNLNVKHISLAMCDKYLNKSMNQDYARKHFKISSNDVFEAVEKLYD